MYNGEEGRLEDKKHKMFHRIFSHIFKLKGNLKGPNQVYTFLICCTFGLLVKENMENTYFCKILASKTGVGNGEGDFALGLGITIKKD